MLELGSVTLTCSGILLILKSATDLGILLPYQFSYTGPKALSEYYVHNTQMCSAIIKGKQGVKVNIYLGRRLISNILTVFAPTIILILISSKTKTTSCRSIININNSNSNICCI